MASTNKTTNYELSQFLGSDKPAWLGDYNTDMAKIDAQMKLNADSASGADGKADANATKIGTLANLTTEAKTDLVVAINEVDGHADTAQNTANTASNNANSAITAIQSIEDYLNLGTQNTYTGANLTAVTGTMGVCSLTVSRNDAGTLCKIYGVLRHKPTATGIQTFRLNVDTGLRPETEITISPAGFLTGSSSSFSNANIPTELSVTLKTNGYLEFTYEAGFVPTNFYYGFANPCLYFVKNWGDSPTPDE